MNEKILVADEESANLKLLEAILTQRGFQVKTASSAEDALNYFKRDSFDLVITDVGMPGEDGLPLMRRIKELDEDVEVIILTGLAALENATEALRVEGVFDYLKKPLDSTDKLIHTVNQAIAKRKLRRENKALFMESEKTIKKKTAKVLKDHELLKREIAERKRIEETLRKSEQRYRALVESSLDGIIVVQDERILFANRQLLEMFSCQKADDMVGHPFTEFISPEHRDLMLERGRTREKGEYAPRSYEFKALRKDGSRFDAELSVGVITFEGQVARQAVVRDITERKRAEERLEHLNLVLYAIRKINLNIAKEKDRDTLLKATCENLVETRGYFNAWIVLLDEHGRLVTTAEAGLGKDFFPMVKRLRRGELTDCGRRASAQPEVIATEDPLSTCSGCPLADKYTGRGALTARMQHGGKNFGILSASILKNLTSDHEEQALFKDVADNIAFALHSIEEEERRKQAEEALKESEQRYRTLVESSTDAILMTDRERKIVTCNQAFLDLFGYKKREIEGKSTRIIHQSDKSFDSYGKTAYPAIEKGDFFRTEWEFMRKDGTIVPVETITSAIRSPDGSITNYHAILRDITERRQAEDALRESESKYRTLVENIPQKIFTKDRNSVYVSCNENYAQDLGIKPDQCAGKTDYDFFPRELADKYSADDKRIMEAGQTEGLEEKYLQDGQEAWVHTIKTPIRQEDGTVIGILGVFWDITKRKQAEEDLKLFRILIDQSNDAIEVIDPKTHYFLDANEKALQGLGYTREEFLSLTVNDIDPNLDQESWNRHGEEILKTGFTLFESRHRRKDGSTFPVEVNAKHVRLDQVYLVNIVRDITERKRAEEEHEKLQAQLEQAQRIEAIGTLAGGIAHDFNNILSAIIGYTQLVLEDVPEGSRTRTNLKEVYKAGTRAKDLVGQILAFSRQREHEQKPVRIRDIVKEALGLLRPSLPTTIEIRQNIQTESDTVQADPSQIHQVLMNLCANAAHAMREKGGILEFTLEDVDLYTHDVVSYPHITPGPYLRLSVSDTGHGMNGKVMKRIFDPYFTTKEKGVGTGLGLAVVDGIVKSHRGAITAYSEPEKGSTFHVYLPRIEHPEASVEVEEIEPLPKGRERILFVDDEKPLVDMTKQMLERLGYQVTARTSSIEALEAFRAQPKKFDLVITDQTMPAMTGKMLAKEITGIKPDIPVILCSGYSEILSGEKSGALGIRDVLRKPVINRELAQTIRRVLDKSNRD